IPFVILGLSSAFGATLLPWQPQTILFLLLFVGYLLPHIVILSEERFHLTLIPILAVLAGNFWTRGFSAITARGRFAVSLALIACSLLLANWGFELLHDGNTLIQVLGPLGNRLFLPY